MAALTPASRNAAANITPINLAIRASLSVDLSPIRRTPALNARVLRPNCPGPGWTSGLRTPYGGGVCPPKVEEMNRASPYDTQADRTGKRRTPAAPKIG